MPETFRQVVNPGLRFANGAVTTSLCCPMRASTLTEFCTPCTNALTLTVVAVK
jgi:hypothetical protein